MPDSEVVASIVAGDPEGFAEAYDRYADSLYKYCRIMLSDPADAADAVQNTFVIAATRLDGLADRDRLRAWLYAVARIECLRIQRAQKTTVALAEVPDVTADDAQAGENTERARLRTLIEDAVAGLSPAEREVIELHLWHGLDVAEIALVLGVPRSRAQSLTSRARDQLEACLSVLAVGRAVPVECAELDGMLVGWDGKLTPALRWWAHRHIERCGTCTARRAVELRPAALFGLSLGAAIVTAAEESLRHAASPPAALKEHTLALAVGQDPSAVAYRAVLLGRAGSFDAHGFPRPLRTPLGGWRHGGRKGTVIAFRQLRTAAVVGVALAVVLAAVAVALTERSAPTTTADAGRPVSTPAAGPSGASGTPAVTPADRTPTASRTPHSSRTPRLTRTTPGAPRTTSAAGPPAHPTPPPTTSRPTSSAAPPPPAATLIVQPSGGRLQVTPFGATITLTARGGQVNWSVTISGGSGFALAQPSNGTLAAGGNATVTILASHHAGGRQVTVSPSGTVFTLETGWGHPGVATASYLALRTSHSDTNVLTYGATEIERTATVSTCATARLSRPSWQATRKGSPRPTTGTRMLFSVTAARSWPSRRTPPTRYRTLLSSLPPGWRDCATRSCCGPGCTLWRATSAYAGSGPGRARRNFATRPSRRTRP